MNYDHNKKFGLLKFHLGYGKFKLNSPIGYSLKIINAQTELYNISKITTHLEHGFGAVALLLHDGLRAHKVDGADLRLEDHACLVLLQGLRDAEVNQF